MTDEQIASMSAPEIAELIKRLIDELILRLMQMSGFGSVRSGDARATFVNGHNGQITVVSRTTTSALNVIRTL